MGGCGIVQSHSNAQSNFNLLHSLVCDVVSIEDLPRFDMNMYSILQSDNKFVCSSIVFFNLLPIYQNVHYRQLHSNQTRIHTNSFITFTSNTRTHCEKDDETTRFPFHLQHVVQIQWLVYHISRTIVYSIIYVYIYTECVFDVCAQCLHTCMYVCIRRSAHGYCER